MTRLTANQIRILGRAAEAIVGWLPGEEVETTTATSLVRRQLFEPAVKDGSPGLAITAAGRAAIGKAAQPASIELPSAETSKVEPEKAKAKAAKPPAARDAAAVSVPGGTKLERVTALLRRDGGATLEELQTATGWQAHSVRGALSGVLKKKHKLAVTSQVVAGRRVYMIAAAEMTA
jgi:hypothetical protein